MVVYARLPSNLIPIPIRWKVVDHWYVVAVVYLNTFTVEDIGEKYISRSAER